MEEYRVLKSYTEQKAFGETIHLEQFQIICAEVDDKGKVGKRLGSRIFNEYSRRYCW